jgi:hypothetical protein
MGSTVGMLLSIKVSSIQHAQLAQQCRLCALGTAWHLQSTRWSALMMTTVSDTVLKLNAGVLPLMHEEVGLFL